MLNQALKEAEERFAILAASIARAASVRARVADVQLSDAIRRGQMPDLIQVLRKALER